MKEPCLYDNMSRLVMDCKSLKTECFLLLFSITVNKKFHYNNATGCVDFCAFINVASNSILRFWLCLCIIFVVNFSVLEV